MVGYKEQDESMNMTKQMQQQKENRVNKQYLKVPYLARRHNCQVHVPSTFELVQQI